MSSDEHIRDEFKAFVIFSKVFMIKLMSHAETLISAIYEELFQNIYSSA
jgi:hypothetical protein